MPFTKKQKEQLILMIEKPDVFLSETISGKININTFNNNFFQNGDGIFHILITELKNNFDKYKNVLYEITKEKYGLNIFQSKLNKQNAFELLISQIPIINNVNIENSNNGNLAKKYVDLINHIVPYNTNLKNVYSYIGYLLNNNEFYLDNSGKLTNKKYSISHILDKVSDFESTENKSNLFYLLEESIKLKNKKALKDLIDNKQTFNLINKDIQSFTFNIAQPYYTKTFSQIDGLLRKYYNTEIVKLIINNFNKIDLNFQNKTNNREHLLLMILSVNDFELADDIYSKMNLIEKAKFLLSQHKIINKISKYKDFYEKVSLDIPLILKSNDVSNDLKIDLIKQILVVDDNSINKKYQNLENMLEHVNIPLDNNYLSIFFLGLKPQLIDENEMTSFVNVFSKLLNLGDLENIHSVNMYNKALFENPILLEKLLNNNFPLYSTKANIYTEINSIYVNSYNKYDYIIGKKQIRDSLLLIKNKEPDSFLSNNSVIESLISNANTLIFDILDDDDFIKISKFHKERIFSYIKNKKQYQNSYDIEKIILKLLDYDFNFNIDIPFVGNTTNICLNILTKDEIPNFLNKTNTNISELIKTYSFWSSFLSDDLFEYLKNKNIPLELNQEDKKLLLANLIKNSFQHQQTFKLLELYPEFLNIYFEDKNNILHKSIKDKNYDIGIYVFNKNQEKLLDLNKKNELALTLIIKDVYNNIKNNDNDIITRVSKEKSYSLFHLLLKNSFIKNNKVMDTINEKLEKFNLIKKTFPKEIEEFNFNYLKNSMTERDYIKKNKI